MTTLRSSDLPKSTLKKSQEGGSRGESNPCYRLTSYVKSFFYRHPPLNPHIPTVPGLPLIGQAATIMRLDNTGFGEVIDKAAALALQDPRGIAQFKILGVTGFLVTNPSDIHQIMHHNDSHINSKDTVGIFKKVFGAGNIFDIPKGPEWRRQRNLFTKILFEDASLHALVQPTQKIAHERLHKSFNTDNIDVKTLVADLLMNILGQTHLGLAPISEKNSAILADCIHATSLELGNPLKHHWPFDRKITSEMTKGDKILRESILPNSAEKLREGKSFLKCDIRNPSPEPNKVFNVMDDAVINDTKMFLVVGEETTAKLLLFSLMLIFDPQHADILKTLRAELKDNIPADGMWTKDAIDNLTYLECILKESIRLYPPIPIIKGEVDSDFTLGNVGRFERGAEYATAMDGRTLADDVQIKKGDFVFVAPWVTQRLESVYGPDARLFKPERWIDAKVDDYAWFPFGFGARKCIGRKFAFQEVKQALIEIATHYNLSMLDQHPFAVEKIFSLVYRHDVRATVTRVNTEEARGVSAPRA